MYLVFWQQFSAAGYLQDHWSTLEHTSSWGILWLTKGSLLNSYLHFILYVPLILPIHRQWTFLKYKEYFPVLAARRRSHMYVAFPNEILRACSDVWQRCDANPGLNFNAGFFIFLSEAPSRIIFSVLFRVSNHQIQFSCQIVGKENLTEFAF